MSTVSKALKNPPNNFSTTLSSNVSSSAITIPLNSTTGIDTEGVGVIYQKDADGNPVTNTIEFIHWTGTSGNNLTLSDTGDRGLDGSASGAQAHSSGDTFEVWVHSEYHFYDWAVTEHNADGTHASTIVKTTSTQTLTNKTLTAPVINAGQFTTEAYFDAEVDNGNSGTADTIDWTAGNKQKSTVTGDVTYTFTAPSGPANLILKLVNGGSQTVTWPGTVLWPGGTEPTWTASGTDIVAFYYDGTSYYGQAGANFS